MRFAWLIAVIAAPVFADEPVIERVTATKGGDGWRFNVTLSHPDTGWKHYADGWAVEDEQGKQLGLRVLGHPHVEEQPFTRSLGGVNIPSGVGTVYVRSRCIVDGWSQTRYQVTLPKS